MDVPGSILEQFRSSRRAIGLILTVSAVLMAVVWLLKAWKGIPTGTMTRDPTAVLDAPFYVGFVSQLGIFMWAAAAAVCLLGAHVLQGFAERPEFRRFLFGSGILSLILGLDDAFLFHEEIFPRVMGMSEKVVFAGYVGLFLFYLVRFYWIILRTEYLLLAMAFLFFGVSVVVDVTEPPGIDLYFFEDGTKLVGIVAWLAYHYRTSVSVLRPDLWQRQAATNSQTASGRGQSWAP